MGRTKPKEYVLEVEEGQEDEFSGDCEHSLQRKAALVHSGPVNHKKDVFYEKDEDFDLNKTIFKSVQGLMGFRRLTLKTRLGNKLYWNPEKKEEIEKDFEEFKGGLNIVLKEPDWNNYQGLMDFMRDECDFSTEHADGSFMDHLYFCRDFTKAYYPEASPRILFLHSIMGVGTNLFPMGKDKIPQLKGMLTENEYHHVECFPTILRLINNKDLLDELLKAIEEGKLNNLQSISMRRVIDNEEIKMSAADFWVAMNLQLIHQMDFLPCSNWCSQATDPLFQVFVEIHDLLTKSEKLDSGLKFSINDIKDVTQKDEFGMPKNLASRISGVAPKSFMRGQLKKSIQGYSQKINHDLTFELEFSEV